MGEVLDMEPAGVSVGTRFCLKCLAWHKGSYGNFGLFTQTIVGTDVSVAMCAEQPLDMVLIRAKETEMRLARANKDWVTSDVLREELRLAGWNVKQGKTQ